jgi:hypothetical protein
MTKLKISIMLFLLLLGGAFPAWGQFYQDESIAQSHIRANVPDKRVFDKFLKRDLQQYFKASKRKTVKIEYELLREGPTQSGIAYPKFYAWVTVRDHRTVVEEGAARVAAVEKKHFDVTDFLSKADIERSPMTLDRVFPGPVADKIRERLGLR